MTAPQSLDAHTNVPAPVNEPVLGYAPGSPERATLEKRLVQLASDRVELTCTIGGKQKMGGGKKLDVVQPHARRHVLGTMKNATATDAREAVAAAKAA
ncbi:MAG: 1-pyrroline-5-carboxylate dehydrogenase, partial [Nocardioidaceae bacterium]|nr:1-pyrroline-5-carboxylate dehydrogenase [Nocardioidaceae bacterium]